MSKHHRSDQVPATTTTLDLDEDDAACVDEIASVFGDLAVESGREAMEVFSDVMLTGTDIGIVRSVVSQYADDETIQPEFAAVHPDFLDRIVEIRDDIDAFLDLVARGVISRGGPGSAGEA